MDVTEDEVTKAIYSFPISGSAGGPDGLRPRHLKDLTGPFAIGGGRALLAALAQFVKHILEGKTPPSVRPFHLGANQFDSSHNK